MARSPNPIALFRKPLYLWVMKKYKNKQNTGLDEISLPFDSGGSSNEGELFDDCPLCQELKRKIEEGEGEVHSTQWNSEEDLH